MGGSEIRSEIVAQHAELRELVRDVGALAERFEPAAGLAPAAGRELLQGARALYEKFGAHLESEQALLEPALLKAGAEGERLADRLRNEHREQRELLKYLIDRLETHPQPTIVIAREIQNFAGFLRYEMEHEENTMLSESVLKGADD